MAINYGAIPETLLESELCGHEKGAYMGAHIQRKDRHELADGGALFGRRLSRPAHQVSGRRRGISVEATG